MSNKLSLVAFIIGGLAFFGILFITGFPEWSRSSQQSSENFLRNTHVFVGIWWRCSTLIQGTFQCDNYDTSILGLGADIQACRALMCIATGFSFIGVLVALLALDCTTMVEPNTKAKNMTALVAGVLFVLAGVCCGGAVSWWAAKVTTQFYNAFYANNEFKYEYGACLYVGWIAMLLALIAGLILTCGSCRGIKEDKDTYKPYTYQPATSKPEKPSTKTEYV